LQVKRRPGGDLLMIVLFIVGPIVFVIIARFVQWYFDELLHTTHTLIKINYSSKIKEQVLP
jgi:hypothetical protein